LEGDIVRKLREWISAQKAVIEEADGIERFDPTRRQTVSSLRMDGNAVWDTIKESLHSQSKQTLARKYTDLKGVNHSYFVSCRTKNLYFALGYRITPSYIMHKGGFLLTSTFDDLIEIEGVKLDAEPSFLLSYDLQKDTCVSVIFDQSEFEQLFDLFEHQKEQAKKFAEDRLANLIDPDIANSVILESRQLVKMLNKPLIQEGYINTEIGYIGRVKDKTPGLAFTVEGNRIVLPDSPKERKQAVKDLIKAISHHFTKTLDDAHVIEGNPIRVVS
jgi:hypothetical protein